jgi:gamma-glutamylcyclotransferase (GGCT)/AIG2-like uncharacterized protein YtfP
MKAKSKSARTDGRVLKRKAPRPKSEHRPQYLFVYGTLKRGGKSHRELNGKHVVRFISEARMRGALYKPCGEEYPGAVLSSVPHRFVKGELFVLVDPQKALPYLDEFEGVDDGLFRRELVDVWVRGRRVKAWTYLYARPLTDANLIPTGIYSSH